MCLLFSSVILIFPLPVKECLPHVFPPSTLSAPFSPSPLHLNLLFSSFVFFLVIYTRNPSCSPFTCYFHPHAFYLPLSTTCTSCFPSPPFIFFLNFHAFFFSYIILGFSPSLFILPFRTLCVLNSPLNLLFRLSFCAFYFFR